MSSHDQPRREPSQHGEQDADERSPEESSVSRVEQDEIVMPERPVPTSPTDPVPAPGEQAGDMWPGVQAVQADADENDEVDSVEGIALAPPGKPDGEADTRP